MRILFISVMIFFMFTLPTFAGSFLPGFADITKESTVFTLYGGSDGQEAWLVVHENLLEEEPGDLLEGIGDIVGLTPSSIYAWYRTRGDIAGDLPEEAQDFFYGIQYDTDTTSDRFGPFIATEIVKWTTDIEMNIGYFGIGTDWNVNEELTLRGAFWNDFGENYRITGNAHWNPYGGIEVNAMAWLMIDDGDKWGLWRLRVSHPVDNDLDVVLVIEDSTFTKLELVDDQITLRYSDIVFLMGFSYNL